MGMSDYWNLEPSVPIDVDEDVSEVPAPLSLLAAQIALALIGVAVSASSSAFSVRFAGWVVVVFGALAGTAYRYLVRAASIDPLFEGLRTSRVASVGFWIASAVTLLALVYTSYRASLVIE